jgi:hypothetical protein
MVDLESTSLKTFSFSSDRFAPFVHNNKNDRKKFYALIGKNNR